MGALGKITKLVPDHLIKPFSYHARILVRCFPKNQWGEVAYLEYDSTGDYFFKINFLTETTRIYAGKTW